MANITKLQLLSDIELQLNQGAISDDSELDRRQIAFWISYELNQLIRQECDSYIKAGKQIPPVYVAREYGLYAEEEDYIDDYNPAIQGTSGKLYLDIVTGKYYKWATDGYVEITKKEAELFNKNQRIFFELSGKVLDLINDRGIVRVLTDEYDLVHKTTINDIDTLNHLRFSKPSSESLVWYREGSSVFIDGLTTADIKDNFFIVDYVKYNDILSLADTDEIYISDAILPILIDKILQRGKLQLYGTTPDPANDGVDYKNPVYHTAVTNPARNEQVSTQQAQ